MIDPWLASAKDRHPYARLPANGGGPSLHRAVLSAWTDLSTALSFRSIVGVSELLLQTYERENGRGALALARIRHTESLGAKEFPLCGETVSARFG